VACNVFANAWPVKDSGQAATVSGGADADDVAASGAAVGAEIDEPIGRFDDVEIVLDDDYGVAAVGEGVQHFEELFDIVEMEPGGRLVQNIKRAARAATTEFLG